MVLRVTARDKVSKGAMTRLGLQKGAVLSVQSRVSYGAVGNRAAEFALQRLGWDVWPVDTVLYSNHPGHGSYRGGTRPADAIAEVVAGLFDLGLAPQCDAVLSGYLGHADVGQVVLESLAAIKAANANAIYCCDPVMGDRYPGVYVDQALIEFFRECAVPHADIVSPNHFELEVLTQRPLRSLEAVKQAAIKLSDNGRKIVVITSVETPETGEDTLLTLATNQGRTWAVRTPKLPLAAKGAGDLFVALFLSQLLRGLPPTQALSVAVSSTFAVVQLTVEQGGRELALIAAQEALPKPPRRFVSECL